MTNEEATEYNKNLREYIRITDKNSEYRFLQENYEALDTAIKALEQQPILDKIREEIANHCGLLKKNHCRYCSYCNCVMGVREIIEVIDKYRAESEDEE